MKYYALGDPWNVFEMSKNVIHKWRVIDFNFDQILGSRGVAQGRILRCWTSELWRMDSAPDFGFQVKPMLNPFRFILLTTVIWYEWIWKLKKYLESSFCLFVKQSVWIYFSRCQHQNLELMLKYVRCDDHEQHRERQNLVDHLSDKSTDSNETLLHLACR